MEYEHRRILENVRDSIAKNIDFQDLIPFLKEYKIFNKYMLHSIHSTADMFDELPCRGPFAFENIIKILKKAKYYNEADILESRSLTGSFSESNLFYKMSSQPLGYCLIINNVKFYKQCEKNLDRLGSDIDAESLKDFFNNIGFEVTIETNKKAKEMKSCLEEFSKRDFQKVDSLIIFILSHGGESNNIEFINGIDWERISKKEIYEIFRNEKCGGHLQNKPKMFFFICCRGKEWDFGAPKILHIPKESLDSDPLLFPSYTDFFIVHSTLPQQISMRDEDKGTFFCEAFIAILKEYYKKHDLETIIDLVNRKLQYKISELLTVQVAHVESRGKIKKIKLCRS